MLQPNVRQADGVDEFASFGDLAAGKIEADEPRVR
jgi:hypothetical protein